MQFCTKANKNAGWDLSGICEPAVNEKKKNIGLKMPAGNNSTVHLLRISLYNLTKM